MLRDEEHRGGIILLHDGQPLPGGMGIPSTNPMGKMDGSWRFFHGTFTRVECRWTRWQLKYLCYFQPENLGKSSLISW